MSFEFEEPSLQDSTTESCGVTQKLSKISYTREFLLSLSELELCKNLPTGFDRSILSEFEDTTHQRNPIPGSSPLLGFRRGDYSSSPPTRGDSSNYSRGVYGKWGSRSSGQSDKDSDSQSDRDSESGRRQGNPSRRSWQSTDHDGLLGSGSFPRPSGYAAGMMASKARGDDHFQLKKSNEPYHPPRPYKAVPHTRKENNDSINEETFGSTDCTSEDRAEEERKRRASFELMRKEQQKVLQEKQKMPVDKDKDVFFKADPALLEQTIEGRALEQGIELISSGSQPPSTIDTGSNSYPPHTSAPRPLVPPGFASTLLEKNSGPKVLTSMHEKVIGKQELEEKILHAAAKPLQNGIRDKQDERKSVHEQQFKDDSISSSFATRGKLVVNSLSGLEVTNQLYGSSSIVKATEALDDGEIIKLDLKINDGDLNKDKSVSILDKLFGSSLTAKTSANIKEPYDGQPEVKQSPNVVQSSKFSHWFLEDEKKQPEHLTSVGPDNLLSLIVGGDKGGVQASGVETLQSIPVEPTDQSSGHTTRLASSSISSAGTEISEQSHKYNVVEAVPPVLTCEDLEEKILSEYTENSSNLQPSVYDNSATGVEEAQSKASVDSHASLHLLSLLHKGTNLKDLTPSSNVEIGLSDQSVTPEIRNTGNALDKSREAIGPLSNSGKNITLEALFGTAFMKELQSVEAPVSDYRSVAGSTRADYIEPHGLAYHVGHDGSNPATIDESKSNQLNFENGLTSNSEQQNNPVNVENWLGFADPQINIESLKLRNEGRVKHGAHRLVQNQLPEEESSLLIGDPLNPSKSSYIPAGSMKNDEISSNTSFNIIEKLAALNAGYVDERSFRAQEGLHSNRGPYDMNKSERQYHNLYAKASPPQFHSPQMSHGRPLFHPIDSHSAHLTSQMKFMAPEGINHDGRINNQLPTNMIRPPFHHPNTTLSGFDLPVHHQMLQLMQAPTNFPPQNVLHEYPRGGPLPPQPSNQQGAFMQEPNLLQGFPFGQQQPNISGLGMQLPAPDVSGGSNHPEALQRLISMEHGANPKPMQTYGISSQGIYNHELDMSSRYR
ncbi:Chorismate synthase [Heracleum sosnowskyi]|uniref:Chorismate synthase n=1 Tax=Heracleum sosnowskyi TaxID=360622 RepID=A0AAD8I0J4_9APIA|nr:Chorismate synthase [Heracleum sosnowskyi]